jgi:peptide/nickel transport system ATP-binding protein
MIAPVSALLEVQHLTTVFDVEGRSLRAVDDVSFEVRKGETLGLVGESGSGKSMTAFSILRLVQPPGRIAAGRVVFEGRDLMTLPEREMRKVRGARIALIFQEPMTALNPVFTVGDQIAESMLVHGLATRSGARRRAVELLEAVRVADPDRRVHDYPHQLSGGMRQRVLIAMAIACRPSLVIADEPTTALDVTIQAQVLDLLREMRAAFDLSMLLISHDLGIIAGSADRLAVMYAGRIVEQGPVRDVFRSPAHPYTKALLASIPRGATGRRLKAIDGTVPSLTEVPRGCAFAPRCGEVQPRCRADPPASTAIGPEHSVRCFVAADGRQPPVASPGLAGR